MAAILSRGDELINKLHQQHINICFSIHIVPKYRQLCENILKVLIKKVLKAIQSVTNIPYFVYLRITMEREYTRLSNNICGWNIKTF